MAARQRQPSSAQRAGFVNHEALFFAALLSLASIVIFPTAAHFHLRWLGWIGMVLFALGLLFYLYDLLVWGTFERHQRAQRKKTPPASRGDKGP